MNHLRPTSWRKLRPADGEGPRAGATTRPPPDPGPGQGNDGAAPEQAPQGSLPATRPSTTQPSWGRWCW